MQTGEFLETGSAGNGFISITFQDNCHKAIGISSFQNYQHAHTNTNTNTHKAARSLTHFITQPVTASYCSRSQSCQQQLRIFQKSESLRFYSCRFQGAPVLEWIAVHIYSCLRSPVILTLRLLMSYIYGAPILDVSRSHTTTQHSR